MSELIEEVARAMRDARIDSIPDQRNAQWMKEQPIPSSDYLCADAAIRVAMRPSAPQPFAPPVPAVAVWAIPREGLPELAAGLYANIMWGREPHSSQVSEFELKAWESARACWECATETLFEMLQQGGHIALAERKQP